MLAGLHSFLETVREDPFSCLCQCMEATHILWLTAPFQCWLVKSFSNCMTVFHLQGHLWLQWNLGQSRIISLYVKINLNFICNLNSLLQYNWTYSQIWGLGGRYLGGPLFCLPQATRPVWRYSFKGWINKGLFYDFMTSLYEACLFEDLILQSFLSASHSRNYLVI